MKLTNERRDNSIGIEIRGDGDSKKIRGYAAVFYRSGDAGTEYELWTNAVERIMPGAFDDVLDDDVVALFNHDFSSLLGRSKAGTLELSVDNVGLAYEISSSDTRSYQDVLKYLERGEVDGSSFQFQIRGEGAAVWQMDEATGKEIRELRKITRLIDVGPVVMPAYTGTTAGARAIGPVESTRAEYNCWKATIDRERIDREKFLRVASLNALTTSCH